MAATYATAPNSTPNASSGRLRSPAASARTVTATSSTGVAPLKRISRAVSSTADEVRKPLQCVSVSQAVPAVKAAAATRAGTSRPSFPARR